MNTPRTATIVKTFRFEAAHQLVGSGTECDRCHGHSYRFEVHLTGPVRETGHQRGMVLNFSDVSRIVKRDIIERLDHRFISARGTEPLVHATITAASEAHSHLFDRDEALDDMGVMIIDVPTTTAEEMAKWIGNVLLAAFLPVTLIRFWETETGCAEYKCMSTSTEHANAISEHRLTAILDQSDPDIVMALAGKESASPASQDNGHYDAIITHEDALESPAFRETC